MTKEEYQRNLVRMFDSLRSNNKGEKNCEGIDCIDCPFNIKVCNADIEAFHAHEAIEIVEQWVKEHPIVTNAMKFKEVFGREPDTQACVNDIDCENCEYYIPDNKECVVQAKFWDAEYKEQAKEVKENRK